MEGSSFLCGLTQNIFAAAKAEISWNQICTRIRRPPTKYSAVMLVQMQCITHIPRECKLKIQKKVAVSTCPVFAAD